MGIAINHFGIIQLRATGIGYLRCKLLSLPAFDDSQTEESLVPTLLTGVTDRPITLLANNNSSGVQLELRTTELDDVFLVNKIFVYNKVVASGYPG